MKKWLFCLGLMFGLVFAPASAFTDDELFDDNDELVEEGREDEDDDSYEDDEGWDEEESCVGPNCGSVYIAAGIDYVSAYVFRGFLVETEGLLLQPWVEGGITLWESDSPLSAIDLVIGLWNSLHHDSPSGSNSGATMDPRAWYEADFYVTLAFTLLENIELSGSYAWYTSPNSSFTTSEEVLVNLSYDDSGLWESIDFFEGLYPGLELIVELEGQSDEGEQEGLFLGPSIAPSFWLGDEEGFSLTVSLPLSAGLSLSNYYEYGDGEDGFFGFFDAGLEVSIPLFFLPERLGYWELSGNIHTLLLGSALQELNGEWDELGEELLVPADELQFYGGASLSISY